MRAVSILLLSLVMLAPSGLAQPAANATVKPASGASANLAEFDRIRQEGNDALYNMDYAAARERYTQMTRLAPDHPAGYVYLANNLWLELLNQSRRLTTSTYTGGSFYEQDKDEDKVDPKRDREFSDLIKQAIAATQARLRSNPKDAEALYYQASAYGLRAGYDTTVKRSFVRAMGDANDSITIQKKVLKADPEYVDAYMSIGLYEYVIDSLPFGWRMLARVAGLKGSKSKGIEHLELVTQKGKYAADDARVLLIGLYTKEGKPERALDLISQLAAKYPRNYLFGIERATMLCRMDRTEEGSRVYADLLKDTRIAAQATDLIDYQWGESLAARGEHATAVERFNAVAHWPKSDEGLISMAHLRAGQSLDALGKRDEAVAEYQTVLKRGNVYDSHKQATQYVKKPYVPQKG
ncbi:MAG: tetratricopeptide repeat protein [Blastocatellia bacterium]